MSTQPKHQQISDAVRELIASKEARPGEILTTASALARQWNVSRHTATKALDALVKEGRLKIKRGHANQSGYEVVGKGPVRRVTSRRLSRSARNSRLGPAAGTTDSGQSWSTKVIELAEAEPPKDVSDSLGTSGPVFIRRRIISVDNTAPSQLATSYIPLDLATPEIREINTGPGGLYARLEDQGIVFKEFTERLRTRVPTRAEIEALEMPTVGVAVVDLERTAYDTDERVVEVMQSVLRSDRYEWLYHIDAT